MGKVVDNDLTRSLQAELGRLDQQIAGALAEARRWKEITASGWEKMQADNDSALWTGGQAHLPHSPQSEAEYHLKLAADCSQRWLDIQEILAACQAPVCQKPGQKETHENE